MACTTILVGKDASYDGSTMVGRNEDSASSGFNAKKFIVVTPEEQGTHYKSKLSSFELDLPENPMQYTCMPNAWDSEGIWGACGVNTDNVAMSATETITSNALVQAADPVLEEGQGIGEEDMVTIVLPYIHSAREGVLRLGKLLEDYGTYEMNGIAFQDSDEIWWLESIGGHHWIAKRVPDDSYVVAPNQMGIDFFDLEDAFGAQEEYMCSADLREFVEENHLNLALYEREEDLALMEEEDREEMEDLLALAKQYLNARLAFGSHTDADHVYNTPRAWILQRYFNKDSNTWDGEFADFKPDSDDIPWSRVPEQKITMEDMKWALSNHYQGTDYDPYGKGNPDYMKKLFRPIGINRNSFLGITQIRPYMPEGIRAVEWLAVGCNVFNALVPFYANVGKTPAYLACTTLEVSTDSFYWSSRLIGALADAHFRETANSIETYQVDLANRCARLIYQADRKLKELSYEDATAECEAVNEEMAKLVKEKTVKTLDEVLRTASFGMKNSFARSDA